MNEKEIVKKYHELKSGIKVAEFYGIQKRKVYCILAKNKDLSFLKNKLDKSIVETICKEYDDNNTITSISKRHNINSNTIKYYLLYNDKEIRKSTNTYRIKNIKIFENIDTEEKAYWLGFLYADGYVKENEKIELGLKESDLDHIKKFKNFLGSNHPIEYRKDTKSYRFSIYSKKIAQDLTKLGCHQAKSLTLNFPTEEQVPKHLLHHFLRGYFDGDGCITSSNGNYRISLLGTQNFLHIAKNILKNIHIKNIKQCTRNKAYEFNIYGRNNCYNFYKEIYKNATIFLDRKHDKFKYMILEKIKMINERPKLQKCNWNLSELTGTPLEPYILTCHSDIDKGK